MSVSSSDVRIFVRIRPTPNFAQEVIRLGEDGKNIDIHLKKDQKLGVVNNKRYDWSFKVDGILHNASQDAVYVAVATEGVSKALQGYNCTIMCYGQTGAGKTHTITGTTENYKQRGIIPRALQQVFREIAEQSENLVTVRISYLEIYNEGLFDLLSMLPDAPASGTQMTIADDPSGVFVKGLSVHQAMSEEHALNLLFEGETNRLIGSHILNKNSSRSHCIFTIHLESHSRTLSNANYTVSKINLVDLAGSERLGKTGSEGQLLREATYINKSLSFLEQVILALADRRDHVPFRQSKLTHALKDSLGGNCDTVLVANVYGEAAQIEETLSTLRFAGRMKCIPAECAIIQRCDPVRMCKNLQREIDHLRRELSLHDTLAQRSHVVHEPFTDDQIADIRSQVRRYLEGSLDDIEIINVRQIQEIFWQFRAMARGQERQVESRLITRSDCTAMSAAHKAGLVDAEGQLVGDVDGQSLGIGVAESSSKPNSSLSAPKPKSRKLKEASSPAVSKDLESKTLLSTSLHDYNGKEASAKEQQDPPPATDTQRSEPPIKEEASRASSPPLKSAAFEDFKAEEGSELSRIFTENKSILGDRKRKLREVTQRINMIKRDMDVTAHNLHVTKLEREKQGEYISDEGQVIIDEEEFLLMVRLKDLKRQYRDDYDELQELRAEAQYCQKLVDQCRRRLLAEFEVWYNESFVLPEGVHESLHAGGRLRPGAIPVRTLPLGEDEQERYERLQQELLAEVPGSLAFNNARIRCNQKHNVLRAAKKKAGLISSSVRNKPPSVLTAV